MKQYTSFIFKAGFILILLGAIRPTSFANKNEDNNGTIKGTVVTSDGKPATSVSVRLKGTKKSGETNADGEFSLRNIAPGNYVIEVSLIGYETLEQTVAVEENQTANIHLTLKVSEKQLQEVVITGSKNKYFVDSSSYVAKIPLSNLENPQVYSVVTKELIKDQQVTDFQGALLNVPGGVPMQNPDRSVFVMLRGFEAYGNIRNGIATGASVFNNVDPVNLERIEVLKGSSATLFGSSITSYGGLVNRVTKKPYDGFGGEIAYTSGQFDASRLTLDINTPINGDKTAVLRVNAAYDQEGSFQDAGDQNKWIIAPSFTYKVNDRITLSFDAEVAYNNSSALIEGGQGLDNLSATKYNQINLPYNSSLTGGDVRNRVGNNSFFAEGKYKLSDKWVSQTVYSYSIQNMDEYNMVFTNFENDSLLSRSVYALRNGKYRSTDIQQNFIGKLNTGKIKHRLLLGLDYYDYTISAADDFIPYDQDVDFRQQGTDNMSINRIGDSLSKYGLSSYVYKQNAVAAYAADVINFTGKLIGMASVRVDHFNSPGDGGYSQTALSPKFGLVYQVVKNKVSLFGNYMNGFQNQSGVNFYRVAFKPQQANQWEGGIKLDIAKGRLSSTLTYYNILVKNILITDVDHPAYQLQNGTQRSKGFEAELIANPLTGLNIVAGYGYNDNSYVESEAYLVGKRPVESPANTLNAWANYKLQHGGLKGLAFGVGAKYVSQMFGYFDADNHTPLPAYTVLYATLTYDQPKYSIGIKVNNITSEKYWNSNGQAQTPSQVTGTCAFKF